MSATATSAPQNKSLEWLNRLRANPKIPLMVAAAAAVAIVVAMVLWAKSPDYRTLYSNLSDQDGGAIVTQLTQMNIPYRFSENGGAIEVPADKVHELRLRLAQQGLPKGGAVGFELLDQEKFGISQFSEQVNYQRALEGELARTIETLGPVKTARVHLAMPKPSLFVREQKSPSASITVNLAPGRAMDDGQITAIVHLVSSAVAGLPPGNVTVVDQSGRLLTQSNTAGRDLNDAQLKYAADVEGRVQRRIESILAPIVGNGNVHAQVTAQIDFANKEQTEEQYQPNGDASQAVLRSRQTNESEQIGGSYPGGVPGALSNQPAPANAAPITTPPANQQNGQQNGQQNQNGQQTASSATSNAVPRNTTRNETANYEVDRTIRHTKMNVGDIERLSVAVVVNYRTLADGKTEALSADQLKQIEDLTREAMGYTEKRGDTLNVVNSPFNATDDVGGQLPFWQQQSFIDQMLNAGRWLLVLIVAWLLWRKAVRPQLVRRQEEAKAVQEAQRARAEIEESVEVRLSKDEQLQQRRNNQRLSAEVMSQRIREMSDNDPRVVALVIRQWMSTENEQ
ncbi:MULTISPECIES: flagellar basal-body MS-ring/collar protein FliF [Phytobacter]|jgi:flagellar M-ring protein FliF|uniref:Flagellar M-ring protein n=1 Tax=Phytobacter diazotrophicus TaxID=395631 RepID=A0ABN6LML3_9ENTR|nr:MULTISPECIES: flagellar basal-body MS-ring/collar protein FliF [Phytobacter]AUU91699.1 flagellar basal body M-ring protein FliF [Enterobacteriaceae bacterium ENNIH3]AUV08284.1 flagellar basal body M-ring protein FliF [Enterobacteriaceae bacterium ENNIH2]MBS6740597.1 flagellar M-ring protein FliF [Enterobacteriaceae bacterium]PTA89438.1 flagellar basal body M-ring protein FliF [Kluyvera sp. Nf5]PWF49896.1 flagellar basal body M-ring protein FliF [[Kluyvera] intestini]SLJ90747.1 flagellar M-